MSKVLYLAFLVAVLVVSTPALAQDDGIPVPECVTELHPCGPFINSTTAEPPFECCQPLGTVIQNDLSCLCSVFSNDELIQSLSVNVSEAITLPMRCSIPFDLVAECQGYQSQRDKKITGSNFIHPSFQSGLFRAGYEETYVASTLQARRAFI
ncbi:non-specific lipid transfer protein GPI-anchored 9 [Spinacia oleracea]|uniref:Non-specific lipid transfer protein GPI-anchored 9 n=1 Tax=Spinacia oleracea TaxID=3562 RepID=A0A9R0IUN9_SPIOL|nr:non-specific lipid transfer protein GPI-anchored 9-like [Spinacia oleracea]